MTEILIDTDTLKKLISGAVSEAMKPYYDTQEMHDRRILELEIINRQEKGVCPQNCPCQTKINDQAVLLEDALQSSKSAHKRLDGMSNAAFAIATIVSTFVGIFSGLIQFVMNHSKTAGTIIKSIGGP